ncbi:MAG: ABC transporter permease [Spirochaetales bacterium]|nr:ABC transporter permease [Spirochaetales bacterium]
MRKLFVLIKYNFRRTAVKKSFVVLTILGPFIIIAMSVLPGLLMTRSMESVTEAGIAVYGGDDKVAEALIASSPDFLNMSRSRDFEESRDACMKGSLDGVLLLPEDSLNAESLIFYTRSGSDLVMTETVRNTVGQLITGMRAAAEGLDPERIARITTYPAMNIVQLKKGGDDAAGADFGTIIYTAIAFIMLLYMTTLLYSQMIGRSVVTEKTSKTVEIMLSSVKPEILMIGKILGMGIAGILQYGIWIAVSLLLIKVAGPAFNLELPALLTTDLLGYLILFFLLSFFLYSGLYAAVGALAEDEQSLGQLQIPFIIPQVLPMVMISYLVMNPDSPATVFLSFFPLTAPMVMFVRIIVAPPGLLHLLLCVGILLVSIGAVSVGSGKIFRQAILRTGQSLSLKEGFKLLFEKKD